MLFKYPVIDSHIHMMKTNDLEATEKIAGIGGYEQYTLLSGAAMPKCIQGNLMIAWAKKMYPEHVYGYAMFHGELLQKPDAEELLQQAKYYHEIGFDGIKMLDGKPLVRQRRGVALDDPCYDPMFTYLEQVEMSVLYHSNDPVEFWDEDKIPEWAKEYGGVYHPDPSWEQVRDETIGILKKHPRLHMTIAHMFFLSNGNNLELAKELLETYPNLMFDITPGWEMFEGFGRDMEGWKQFFIQYADRIVYGTDICGEGGESILDPLRRCMETEDVFEKSEITCHGLNLPDEVLKKVYRDTYKEKIQPENPRTIDMKLLEEYKDGLDKYIVNLSAEDQEEVRTEIDRIWKMIQKL